MIDDSDNGDGVTHELEVAASPLGSWVCLHSLGSWPRLPLAAEMSEAKAGV